MPTNLITNRIVFGSLLALTLAAGAADASAKTFTNANLKGVFPFNETIIAAVAPVADGQTECGSTLPPGSVQQQLSLSNQGNWTFDGAGHLTIDDTGVLQLVPGTGQAADVSASAASCAGTYQINQDATVTMAYTCSLAGGAIQFDVQAKGIIASSGMLIAVPPADGGGTRILPEYFVSGGTRTLIACTVVGENTNLIRVHRPGQNWPVN